MALSGTAFTVNLLLRKWRVFRRLAACASFFNDNIDNGDNGHTATCGVLRGAAAVVCVVIVVVIRGKGYRLWVMEFTGWRPALLFF